MIPSFDLNLFLHLYVAHGSHHPAQKIDVLAKYLRGGDFQGFAHHGQALADKPVFPVTQDDVLVAGSQKTD